MQVYDNDNMSFDFISVITIRIYYSLYKSKICLPCKFGIVMLTISSIQT